MGIDRVKVAYGGSEERVGCAMVMDDLSCGYAKES